MADQLREHRYVQLSQSKWFLTFAIVAAASLLTANIVAVKLVSILGFVLPGGAIVYPITFIVDDMITEVYGYSAARAVIWYGFLANLLFVVAAEVVLFLPAAGYWDGQEAYERILGYTPRLLAAAFVSYLVGTFANAIVMSRMKIWTKGRALWTRTISSTFVGQGLDSLFFVSIAFAGQLMWSQLLRVIITVWLFKTAYEVVLTPITYIAINWLKKTERLDTFDTNTNYNPFILG